MLSEQKRVVHMLIESKLPRVRIFRCAVGNHHLCKREAIENRAYLAIVIVGYSMQGGAFTMAETKTHLPLLPFDFSPIDAEAYAFWLRDVEGFDVRPELEVFLCSESKFGRGF